MRSSKTKKKRVCSNCDKSTPLAKLLGNRVTDPYGTIGGNSALNRKNDKSGVRSSQNKGGRMHTSNYQFPQFAIYFKESSNKGKTIDSSVLEGRKKSTIKSSSVCRSKVKGVVKSIVVDRSVKDVSFRQGHPQTPEKVDITFRGQQQPESSLEARFKEAIGKIFKLLDIFNRGKISQTNINKWIPQSALYFLGSIFQHIKLQRLSLSLDHFLTLCLPLLHSSNPDDLETFIKQAKNASNMKYSINMTDELPEEMSPIKQRMMQEQLNKSQKSQKASLVVRNGPLDDVMRGIKCREAELEDRINQIKERKKSVTFKDRVLEQIQPSQLPPSSTKLQDRFEFYSPQKPILKSILKSSHKASSSNTQNNNQKLSQSQLQYPNSPVIANFTFQLPIRPAYSPQIPIRTAQSIVDPNPPQPDNRQYIKLDSPMASQKSRSFQALSLIKQNVRSQIKSKTHRHYVDNNDNDRLDRLQKKIQQYMHRNAQKLEQSRSLFPTSPPR